MISEWSQKEVLNARRNVDEERRRAPFLPSDIDVKIKKLQESGRRTPVTLVE
jgi:hypothetical protein